MTVFDINDNDVIVGSFRDPAPGKEHGFFGTLDGQYRTFDFGGSSRRQDLFRGMGRHNKLLLESGIWHATHRYAG